jgi:molybdate-binding protein/DNA-binding transcriptional regulator YhcF (GntR family)
MNVVLNPKDPTPIYLQIAQAIRQDIAGGGLTPGQALPTVRDLARQLAVNQNTVARAYGLLHDESLLEGRGSLGTRVAVGLRANELQAARDAELRLLAARFISDALGRGFTLPEAEASFVGQRARWQEKQDGGPARPRATNDPILGLGSNDLCLELLIVQFQQLYPKRSIAFASVGSLAGLLALASGEVHFAAAHLYDPVADDYNAPFLATITPSRSFALVTLAHRTQGLLVAVGNPLDIHTIQDLALPGIRIVNRQRGSGTRVLLDQILRQANIPASVVAGYEREEKTHAGVASAVAGGSADAGLGIQAAARSFGLDFVPLVRERYELALLADDPAIPLFLQTMAQPQFRLAAQALGGYDLAECGRVRLVQACAPASDAHGK